VFATKYSRGEGSEFYPMAWGIGEEGVVGLDRSDHYTQVCGACT
jgi:hypothetical protein